MSVLRLLFWYLTHFSPVSHFYTPWKRQKTKAWACIFIKKEALAQVFSYGFCKISKNTFYTEHLRWLLLSRAHDNFVTIAVQT